MRPSPYDKSQPHHRINDGPDDTWRPHCKCGYDDQGYTSAMRSRLDNHIRNSFDGRCHFRRYGMECVRYYGHRGLHRSLPARLRRT